jgi:hypothetical protein
MAEQAKSGKGAATGFGAPAKAKRKHTQAQLKARRERAAAQRKAKAEEAENARRAALSPAELIAEDEAAEELRGAAKTIVTAELYKAVMRDWTRGMSEGKLSEKHGLSPRRVRQIVDELRGTELTRLGVGDPLFSVKFAQRLVLQRSAAVSQYAELAEDAPESQPQVKLGYLRLRDQALDAFTALVQELGWLPRHLGTLNTMMDAMQMAEAMLEVMDREGVAIDVQRAIVEAIELRVVRRGPGLALAGVGPVMDGTAIDVDEVHDDGRGNSEPDADSAGPGGASDGDVGRGEGEDGVQSDGADAVRAGDEREPAAA